MEDTPYNNICKTCEEPFFAKHSRTIYCYDSKCIHKRLYAKERIKAVEALRAIHALFENKCVSCGFDDIRALQIDHIVGSAYKEKGIGNKRAYYRKVLRELEAGSKKYQLLCANCNWIKRFSKGSGHLLS